MARVHKQNMRATVATEARVAKDYGGSRTPRSGADHIKGDIRAKDKVRIEVKQTAGLSYRLHIDEWDKIEKAAKKAGEMPIFHIVLTDRLGKEHDFTVMRHRDASTIINEHFDRLEEDDE